MKPLRDALVTLYERWCALLRWVEGPEVEHRFDPGCPCSACDERWRAL